MTMPDKIPRIGVVGSSNVDLVTYVDRMPVWGETIAAPRFEMNHGGKGANQAVAAAKLGAAVLMVSKVGDDMLGDGVPRNFEETNVSTRHVQCVPGQSTGTATILVNASGDNCILIVRGANGDLTPADIERAAEELKACDLILTQLEVPLESVYATIAFGKRHGVKTALNPAPALPNLDLERIRDASFITPNETELAILTGMPVESEDEIAAAARSLLAKGLETVIVTLGARGSLVATPQGLRRVAPVKVQAVDSTGAGDAFIGSFARYFASGLGLDAALARATRYAADSVTRRGAQKSYATEAEFEAFCAGLEKTG
ncbi:MAG TPA: ribokinase [Roseiarcus sp.]|nr:ribokinase [Roseiarcus sp.]